MTLYRLLTTSGCVLLLSCSLMLSRARADAAPAPEAAQSGEAAVGASDDATRDPARGERDPGSALEAGHDHFDRGVEYVRDGDLQAALIEFKRAYAAAPNYRVLYNLGQVCDELRQYTDAQRYFERYLKDGGEEIPADRRGEVEALLAKLSDRIATLVLSSNVPGAKLFVDEVPVGESPLSEPVRVSTGRRTISAAISGRPRITRVVEAAGGDTLVVRLEFPPIAHEATSAPRPQPMRPVAREGSGAVLWLGIGSGALAVGAGVMAYLAARDAQKYHDAVQRKTTARELDDLDKRARAKALATDILLGAAAVATTVTVIAALQGDSGERAPALRGESASTGARLTLGAGALALSGRFE